MNQGHFRPFLIRHFLGESCLYLRMVSKKWSSIPVLRLSSRCYYDYYDYYYYDYYYSVASATVGSKSSAWQQVLSMAIDETIEEPIDLTIPGGDAVHIHAARVTRHVQPAYKCLIGMHAMECIKY